MFGVLVDVSGSMQSAYALDRSRDANVERVHAIITTIINIVKREVIHHDRQASIFVSAFGLCRTTDTCDLISLLDCIAGPRELRGREVGHEALIELAKRNGAAHAEKWIKDHLSDSQAQDLYRVLCFDPSLIPSLIELLSGPTGAPAAVTLSVLNFISFGVVGNAVEGVAVHNSEAYQFAEKLIRDKDNIINRALERMQKPKPRSVRYVSELLDDLNLSKGSSAATSESSSESLHDRIQELIDPIKPYIFGGTPMHKAMNDALAIFKEAEAKSKVLFILSDGASGDGDPRPIAQKLQNSDVTIVTCYLTADHIDNPRCLLDKAHPSWPNDGRAVLFDMSSTMRNIDPPLSYLVDAKWEVPSSGVSRLFVQANSLDVVDEVCETVVSQMTNPCDALVDILAKVPLATYINQRNAEFEPKKQDGGTCYANAVAAVFHLAMHRIIGREGGYPDFYTIRDRLIKEYGKKGANTRRVLENVCPEYRLHVCQVDETHARQALNKRRPVVTTFSLFDEQWTKFSAFYRKSPKKILQKNDVGGGSSEPGGHAVVLIKCNPSCLIFLNSWGQHFADGGFFRVKDANVLNVTTFYDVYWTVKDLTPREIEAYEKEGIERAKELSQTFPSINDVFVECPNCKQYSRVGEFTGHLLDAKCPKCRKNFKPTNKDILDSLYSRNTV